MGTKDADSLIASLFASLYASDASLTLEASLSSAVNDLIVVMPCRLLFRREFKSATCDLTLEYLTPILLWYMNDPATIIGIGTIAHSATSGATENMIPPTTMIVVAT